MIFLESRLKKREEQSLYRSLNTSCELIDLTSNDYFGFSRSQELINICNIKALGSTGSRLLTGNSFAYQELEEEIAHFHKKESCLIFNSGYTANLGLISALGSLETTFIYDREIHASMIDGMRLSQSKAIPFRHNDLNSLEKKLQKVQPPIFVLVESLYSISGDFAPLKEIFFLAEKYSAFLIVDEAHATGVIGPNGRGCLSLLGISPFAQVHTFSKALGVHGGCILGSKNLKNYLINFSRPFIYSTALPEYSLLCIKEAYYKLEKEADFHQGKLQELILYFQNKFPKNSSFSPIQPISISGVENVRLFSKKLKESNIDVRPILSPSIKQGKECLRVVLHSFNNQKEIDLLAKVLQ